MDVRNYKKLDVPIYVATINHQCCDYYFYRFHNECCKKQCSCCVGNFLSQSRMAHSFFTYQFFMLQILRRVMLHQLILIFYQSVRWIGCAGPSSADLDISHWPTYMNRAALLVITDRIKCSSSRLSHIQALRKAPHEELCL